MIEKRLLVLADATAKASLLPNQKLRVKPNTALDALVKNGCVSNELLMSAESLNECLGMVCDKSNTTFIATGMPCSLMTIDKIMEENIKPLTNQINFVRNVVNPIVRELEESVKTHLESKSSAPVAININKIDVPDHIQSTLLPYVEKQLISTKYEKGPSFKPTFKKDISRDEIMEMAKSTSDEVNEGLLELAAYWNTTEQGDLFVTAYETLLLGQNDAVGQLGVSYRNFMMAVVAFMIADNISKEPIGGLGLNQANLNVWCAFFKSSCARVIQSVSNMITNAVRSEVLVHSFGRDLKNREVTVYGRVYDNYSDPDKLEILIGLLNTEDRGRYNNLQSIQENADKLKSRGQFILNAEMHMADNLKTAMLVDAIHGSVTRLLEETKTSEENSDLRAFITEKHTVLECRAMMNEFFNKRYPGNMVNKEKLKMVLANLVCELFFKETMASTIIQSIAKIETEKPNATQTEIISQALLNLVIEWLCSQIEIVSR